MDDAQGTAGTALTHDDVADRGSTRWSVADLVVGGAVLGAVAGVAIAVALTTAEGLPVFVAAAIDIAAGLALIGGLIAANFAGTD